jgi:hypothetical protein
MSVRCTLPHTYDEMGDRRLITFIVDSPHLAQFYGHARLKGRLGKSRALHARRILRVGAGSDLRFCDRQ